MICKNYVVTGEDVNNFMVMEDDAYVSYTLRLLYRYLFENGYSKEKLNSLHLGLQQANHEFNCYKNLMFTEHFFIEIKHCYIDDKISVESCFFNLKKECCAEAKIEVEWFDHNRREIIATPKAILHYFKYRG